MSDMLASGQPSLGPSVMRLGMSTCPMMTLYFKESRAQTRGLTGCFMLHLVSTSPKERLCSASTASLTALRAHFAVSVIVSHRPLCRGLSNMQHPSDRTSLSNTVFQIPCSQERMLKYGNTELRGVAGSGVAIRERDQKLDSRVVGTRDEWRRAETN